MENNSVFDDIIQGLHEIEEYQKGHLKLKSTVLNNIEDDIAVKFNRSQKDDSEAERFIALVSVEPFDYTKWRKDNLFKDMTVDELSKIAMEYRQSMKNS